MRRIPELDGLRGIAVLGVIASHVVSPIVGWYTGLSFGWAGVDLFFVLSGFLITGILRRTRNTTDYYRHFYGRRARRILPAALLALTVYTVGMIHAQTVSLPLLAMYGSFTTSVVPSAWWFARLAPQPAWIGFGIGVMWTLSIEELFYLGWAPVVRRGTVLSLTVICAAAIAACPIIRIALHSPTTHAEYFWFFARIDALAWGALCALVLETHRSRLTTIAPALASGCLCALFVTLLVTGHGDPGNTRFATFGYTILDATCAAVLIAAVVQPVAILRIRALTYVGTISYGLYLVHQSIAQIIIRFTPGGHEATALRALLTFGLSMLAATISWHWMERPILQAKNRGDDRHYARATA